MKFGLESRMKKMKTKNFAHNLSLDKPAGSKTFFKKPLNSPILLGFF